jgi:hypothetical protein
MNIISLLFLQRGLKNGGCSKKFTLLWPLLGPVGFFKMHLESSYEVACRVVLEDYVAVLGLDRHHKVVFL